MEAWAQLAVSGGIGAVIVLGTGYGLWKGTGWTGLNIIIPVRDRLLKFFDNLDVVLPAMKDAIEKNTELTQKNIEATQKNIEATQKLNSVVDERLNCTRLDCDLRVPTFKPGNRP